MEYLKNLFNFQSSNECLKEYRVEEITESDRMETPLQIISDAGLWREIASTYNIDNVVFFEWHFENGPVHYFETNNLKFNLKTLRPCQNSTIRNTLNPGLVSRIKNNPAYRRFSQENVSFNPSNSSHQSFDLMQLQSDYLDYYFDLEYDHRLTSDNMFRNLPKEDRINFINLRHQEILNSCKGLRYNI